MNKGTGGGGVNEGLTHFAEEAWLFTYMYWQYVFRESLYIGITKY